MNYISKLPIKSGIKLIYKALEKREEQKAWDMWLTLYPRMNEKTYFSFTDFYKNKLKPISTRPTDEILAEVEEIRKQLKNENTTSE